MSSTIYDAMRHSQNPYAVMLLKQIATSDMSFGVVPFVMKGSEGFSYEREVSTGSFNFIAPGGSVANSTGTTERVTISKREATEDFWVDNFAADNQTNPVSPVERQTQMKLKAAGRAIAGKMITGVSISSTFTIEAFQSGDYVDAITAASPFINERYGPGEIKYTHSSTTIQFRAPGDREFGTAVTAATDGDYTIASEDPSKWITVTLDVSDATADAIRRITFTASNEFDGLQQLVSTGQTRDAVGTDGDALSFTILEELYDSVKVRTGQLAYVMNSAARRKYNQLVRTTNAAGPDFVMQASGIRVPTFDGIPILTNDFIPSTESKGSSGATLTSVYLVNYEPEAGVYMGCLGGESMDVMADPRNVSVMGFRLRELGQHQSNSQVGRRLSWYGAQACGSDLSLARARQLST